MRAPLRCDRREQAGPFDVIGDVHGCLTELRRLLGALGYREVLDEAGRPIDATPPADRRAIFLGDVVDRGPDSVGCLRLVMGMCEAGHALAVPGNHEAKLVRALAGKNVQRSHGLAETMSALERESPEFRDRVQRFWDGLVTHLVLDDGRLVVAHAGLTEAYQGRASARVRAFALYGQTTGETDEFGLPVRYPWAEDYRGAATVLYGHTPVPAVEWLNNTACLDTGCVFGGALSAMRYPEREVVSVPAERQWQAPARPLAPPPEPVREPNVLDIADVSGKILIETSDAGRVTIREEQAAGALETMSRFAIDPRLLTYLPPTMSPATASREPGFLEHPREAFEYFRDAGVTRVICEEKHMGSRAVLLLARDPRRFAAPRGWRGTVHTRTGRAFFSADDEARFVERAHAAVASAGLWKDLDADWLVLDGEALPWSYKAEPLIKDLYASVGAAGAAATAFADEVLARAAGAGLDVAALRGRTEDRGVNVRRFRDAYRRYVGSGRDVTFAPFQLLAAGGETFEDRDHGWHLAIADRLIARDPALFKPTRTVQADLGDDDSVRAATEWWRELTDAGGEGMVVKPFANRVRTNRGLIQPGLKVRGREYLRIIYGPDYLEAENLERLRNRATDRKRSLAMREYALGLEALRRAAAGEPLWRVHEAVFGVLALESDPVDPRL